MYNLMVLLIVIEVILIIFLFFSIHKNKKLKTQVEFSNSNLTVQEKLYSEMISKAKSNDSLSKLRRMKLSHYQALQYINSVIRDNYYKTIPPHKQPKLVS